ncbi:MAG: lipoyl protein ligase domain-containing protein [Bacteroidota bacterium]
MNWRFIDSGALPGEINMAIDIAHAQEVVMDLQMEKEYKSIFRIYGWDKPTLSLGKHQQITEIIDRNCSAFDIPIVTRPTGGRAVLHANELTYCITMPCKSMEEARKAYHDIHMFLLKCLQQFPLADLEFAKGTLSFHEHYQQMESSACFSASARHEVTCKGKKLIGSAQRISDGVLLQHGSLPLDDSYLKIAHLLSDHDEQKEKLLSTLKNHSTSLGECLGYSCDFSEIADIISHTWNQEPFISQ